MAIKRKAGGRITGLSGDAKPTAAAEPVNTIFDETDSHKKYYNSGSAWVLQENYGATSVADGGTTSHGLATAPTTVLVTPRIAGEFVSVTARTTTTFTLAIKKPEAAGGMAAGSHSDRRLEGVHLTIKHKGNQEYEGLSSDTKPLATDTAVNATFVETDTGKDYYNTGSAWVGRTSSSYGGSTKVYKIGKHVLC